MPYAIGYSNRGWAFKSGAASTMAKGCRGGRNGALIRACTGIVLGALLGLTSNSIFAQSNVTLYGQVDAWVGAQAVPGKAQAWLEGGGGMSTSYWGIRGSEDLGGGTKAEFTLESFFRPQSGVMGSYNGEPFFGRSAYVGLSNDRYGALKLGRIVSPYLFPPCCSTRSSIHTRSPPR